MRNALQILLEVSLYSSAMIIVVFALGKLFSGKISAKLVYVLWLLVLLRLLLPVTFESPVNIPYPVFEKQTAQPAAAPETDGSYTSTSFEGDSVDIQYPSSPYLNTASAASESTAEKSQAPALKFNVWDAVLSAWLLGAVLFLAVSLYRITSYSRKISIIASADIRYRAKLMQAKNMLGIRRNVRIAESKYVDIPLVYGYFRPVVLFPKGFCGAIDDEKLSYIIIHELCHVKRKDVLINYIWMFAKAFHWFNPLVYIAHKCFLDSVEECCDEMVAGYLDPAGKCEYTQSLVDVIRLSKKRYRLPMSIPFGKKETTIRKRVIKLMHPKKKSKTMLFATIFTACVMCFACFTTACQATPESTAVQNKNNDIMEQKISQGQVEETQTGNNAPAEKNENGNERAEMIVADTWKDDTIEPKPNLSISVDAQILVPDVANYRVYEITPDAAISNDTVKNLIRALVGDAELHDGDEITKGEIEARLVEINKAIYDLENDVDKSTYSSDDGWDYEHYKNYEINRYNKEKNTLNDLMASAAEDYRTTIDINNIDFENTEHFEAKAFIGRSSAANIVLYDSLYFNFDNPGGFTIGKSYIDESKKNISLSVNDATTMGNMLLSDAGLDMYDIESIGLGYQYIGKEGSSQENSPQGYVIHYERIVNGMPVSSTTRFNAEDSEEDAYKKPFQDESLQVAIDDSGIAQLNWESCYQLDEDSASVVDIMPMDDVMKDIIIQQMFNCYSVNGDDEYVEKMEYTIKIAELVMGRVPMRDNTEMEWLVPVWNIYADYKIDYKDGRTSLSESPSLVLSVNALDGSIN